MGKYASDIKKIVGIKELEGKLLQGTEQTNVAGTKAISYDTISGAAVNTGTSGTSVIPGVGEVIQGVDDVLGPNSGFLDFHGELRGADGLEDEKADFSGQSTLSGAVEGATNGAGLDGVKDGSDLWSNAAAGVVEAQDFFEGNLASNSGNIVAEGQLPWGLVAGEAIAYDAVNDQFVNSKLTSRLAGITGLTDCATGENMSFLTEGNIPPLGFLTTNAGSTEEGYTTWFLGIRWPNGVGGWVADASVSAEAVYQNNYAGGDLHEPSGYKYDKLAGPFDIKDSLGNPPPGNGILQYTMTLQATEGPGIPPLPPSFDINVLSGTCTPGVDAGCPISQPDNSDPDNPGFFWGTSDLGAQIVRNASTGTFSTNPADTANVKKTSYKPGQIYQIVHGCFTGKDNLPHSMIIGPAADGGYFITETDINNPSIATGDAFLFGPDNRFKKVVSSAELKYHLPHRALNQYPVTAS